ncbi:hypothetical protein C8Q79DRAFT_1010941 [Trametes meyenii]|nr:hypothetical protein C8Q79DRAFT_1010941 [Trametes meyenii]
MTTEEPLRDSPAPTQDTSMQVESTPAPDGGADARTTKKRPRIDMATEPRERKRGKTMFGLVLGTLTKAKNEDKERNASDADCLVGGAGWCDVCGGTGTLDGHAYAQAKKRQLIEQRLQDKLRKETDSVRRAEEAKKDKTSANRKEEDLQLKDSIQKLRRTRLPLLPNFLLTSDVIPSVDSDSLPSTNPLAPPPRSRPPPLYYLPAKLLPSQEAFLQRRKAEVKEATEKEWEDFKTERAAGVEEINKLRQRVAEEESRRKAERPQADENAPKSASARLEEDTKMAVENDDKPVPSSNAAPSSETPNAEAKMEVDDGGAEPKPAVSREGGKEGDEAKAEGAVEGGKKIEATPAPAPGYDDDAVEY